MSGLKNLMPKGIFAPNNYSILKKRSEDFKRSINAFVEHLQQINKIYQNYYGVFEKNTTQLTTFIPYEDENSSKLFKQIITIFKGLNKQLRNFIQKQSNNQKPILQLSDLFMADYNVLVEKFQETCNDYIVKQQNLIDSCQNYFKMYKQMVTNIQSYKNSFMEVNIIYNKDQKIKRYNQCVYTYKNLEQDLVIINKKVQQLNKDKSILAEKYLILERQLTNFTSSFATRYIDELKKFAESLFQSQKNKLQIMIDKILSIQKSPNYNFFICNINLRYQELIQKQVRLQQIQYLPCFIYFSDRIKQQAIPLYKKMVVIYFQELSIRIEKRKLTNKKMIEYIQKYVKTLDKTLMESYKQALLSFDKIRKKIGEVFGNRWISFYKIISSLFQNSIQNIGRLMKRVQGKIKSIEITISEQTIIFDSFLKEFRNYIQKVISKKIFKKYSMGEQKSDVMLEEQLGTSRQQIKDMCLILRRQITKVNESILKADTQLKQQYMSFLSDVRSSISQFYGFCNQITKDYYRQDIYIKNHQLCQDQIVSSVKKQMKFFEEIQFSTLLKQNSKITFDGEFNKIQGFKKIKKPKELEVAVKQGRHPQSMQFQTMRDTQIKQIRNSKFTFAIQQNPALKAAQKQIFIGESSSKYAQYLSTRIQFELNEKFIKSCSCALSDKILLSGRMFITTHRLFFYSKFNRSNIFFGQTFIQVPKKDIKKIQKRTSSLFMNNSISITTVNGQLYFTSLLTRDKIFDILKNTFQVNTQDIFFQEQDGEGVQQQNQQLEFQDDMKPQTAITRQAALTKKIGQFKYQVIYNMEFELFGLNPVKFLKLFELDQQVNINRTAYSSFSQYLKDAAEHKEINIEAWSPNPMDYLNTVNIKEIIPQIFTRKVAAVVPLPNSGIPFMPKSSLTTEDQTLFIFSKDKYIIELIIKNQGVPYCDAFDIRMKKTVERADQNKVKMTVQVFTNFNQNVMVKSTIEAKTIESSKENFQKIGNQIKSYIKVLEKKMMKSNKKQTPQDKILEQQQQIQELENQIKNLKDQQKILQEKSKVQENAIKIRNIVLIVLAVICIIQLILLIS